MKHTPKPICDVHLDLSYNSGDIVGIFNGNFVNYLRRVWKA